MLGRPPHIPEDRIDNLLTLPIGNNKWPAGVDTFCVVQDFFEERAGVRRTAMAEMISAPAAGLAVEGEAADRRGRLRGSAAGGVRHADHRSPSRREIRLDAAPTGFS